MAREGNLIELRRPWYVALTVASLSLALFGRVPTRYGYLWAAQAIGSAAGSSVALVSLFTHRWFYPRVGLMAAPFFARSALYLATPDALPQHNDWAACTSNMLIGFAVVLLASVWAGDTRL